MDWSIFLGILSILLGGLNIFQLLSARAFKKKYQSEAERDEAVASETKQSALERRLAAVENLYTEQGKVVDSLRIDYLRISQEKFETEKKMARIEVENRALQEKVDRLVKEVRAYKILIDGNGKA